MLGEMGQFSLGDALINITGKVGPGLNTALGEAEGRMKKGMGNILAIGQKVGFGMTAVGTGIMGVVGAMTNMGMEAVESENLFDVSVGKMADSARAWSNDLSKSLGLNAYEIRKNVGTFDAMLKGMGLSEKAALDFSEGLTKLSYDMASFYNLKPEEAFMKLRSGISGESEPLKELGVLISDDAVKAYALSHGLVKAADSSKEMAAASAKMRAALELENLKFDQKVKALQASAQGKVKEGMATDELALKLQKENMSYQQSYNAIMRSHKATSLKKDAIDKLNLSHELAIRNLEKHSQSTVSGGMTQEQYAAKLKIMTLEHDKATASIMTSTGKVKAQKVQLDDVTKITARYGLIMERTQLAQGDMARTLDSPTNKLRTMKSQIQMLATDIGMKFLPALSSILQSIAPVVSKVSDWVQKNPELTTQIAIATAGFGMFNMTLGPILMALPQMISLASGLSTVFTTLTGGALSRLIGMGGGGFLGLAKSIGGIVAAGAIGWQLGTWLNNMADKHFPAVARAIDSVFDKVVGLIEKFKEWIGLNQNAPVLGERSKAALAAGKIPGLATRGTVRAPWTMVGERGPELVSLPYGSRVHSSGDTAAMMREAFASAQAPGNVSVTINTPNKVTPAEARQIGRMIFQELARRKA